MSHYYLICRSWVFFTPDSPYFKQLNQLPDDEFFPELDRLCLGELRENRDRFKKKFRRQVSERQASLEKHQASRLSQQSSLYVIRGSRSNPLACRIARVAGWVDSTDHEKFGDISPSALLVVFEGEQQIVETVKSQMISFYSTMDNFPLQLMFFSLPVADIESSQRYTMLKRRDYNLSSRKTPGQPQLHASVERHAMKIAIKLERDGQNDNTATDKVTDGPALSNRKAAKLLAGLTGRKPDAGRITKLIKNKTLQVDSNGKTSIDEIYNYADTVIKKRKTESLVGDVNKGIIHDEKSCKRCGSSSPTRLFCGLCKSCRIVDSLKY